MLGWLGKRVGKKILDKRENGRTELVCYQWKDIPNRGTHGGKKEFCWKVILNGGKNFFFFLLEEVPKRRGRGVIKASRRASWFCWKILNRNKSG